MKRKNVKFIFQFKKLFLLGCICNIFITVFKMNMVRCYTKDIMYLFISVFGNLDIKSNNFIFSYTMYLFNFIFVLQITSNYIHKDFNKESIYIFTRTDNKNRWINYKFFEMIQILLSYYVLQFLTVFALGKLNGFSVINKNSFIIIILAILVNILLSVIIISLLCNLLSFKLGDLLSFSIGAVLFSLSFIAVFILRLFNIQENVYKFIPFISSITSWNCNFNNIIDRNIDECSFFIINNNFFINIIVQALFIVLMIKIIKIIINRIDIL